MELPLSIGKGRAVLNSDFVMQYIPKQATSQSQKPQSPSSKCKVIVPWRHQRAVSEKPFKFTSMKTELSSIWRHKIHIMLFTSHNTPPITFGKEQCLKLLHGVCNTKNRGDLSLSLGTVFDANAAFYFQVSGPLVERGRTSYCFYVLLPYIIYVMQSRRFSQSPAFLSRTAKERDKKYIVKAP